MSVRKATIVGGITVLEEFSSAPAANPQKGYVTMDGFDNTKTLDSGTTPNATDSVHFEKTLSAGTGTIDLTSITGPDSATKNFDTKKVRAVKFRAKSTTNNAITIAKGASNGFTGLGSSFSVTLPANTGGGAWMEMYCGTGTAVSSTVKTLDLTGTGTDVLEVAIVVGT